MELYIKKRFSIVFNLVCFLFFTLILIYVSLSIKVGKTAFSPDLFFDHRMALTLLSALLAASTFSILKFRKFSLHLSGIFIVSALLFNLFSDQDWNSKINLITSCLILITAYPLLAQWSGEINSPYLNPLFSSMDLGIHKKIPAIVKIFDDVGRTSLLGEGFLTNWGPQGCFVRLKNPFSLDFKRVFLTFQFSEKVFKGSAMIMTVSKDRLGIGLYFDYNKEQDLGWSELYGLLYGLGFIPEHVA